MIVIDAFKKAKSHSTFAIMLAPSLYFMALVAIAFGSTRSCLGLLVICFGSVFDALTLKIIVCSITKAS